MRWLWPLMAGLLAAGCATGGTGNGVPVETVAPLAVASPEPVEGKPEVVAPETVQALSGHLQDVYFETEESVIRPSEREALVIDARVLRRHPELNLVVEGHCDERGTAAYNLALGQRRAESVRLALMALGVEARRMSVVSHGEERPQCREAAESCWWKNRRVRIRIVGAR